MSDKRDQSKFIMLRYDNYINGVNTKGNFLLVFNTFFAGLITANYNSIILKVASPCGIIVFKVLLVLFLICALIAIVKIFQAVYPFLKSGNSSKDAYHSLIFFQSVSEFESSKAYREKFEAQKEEDLHSDLVNQSYELAVGLKKKFKYISDAMHFIYAELVFIILMFLTVIIF